MTHEGLEALAKIVWQDLKTGELKQYVLVEGATASIGRSKSNDICVPERHVSRRHAVIHYRDGIFMISDLGSANGTYVNDQRLEAPFPLAGGDNIRLFVPELKFSAAVTEEDEATASLSGTLIVPRAPAHDVPTLVVTSGTQEGAEFPFVSNTLVVGRATANASWDICLQDRAVSRPHARIERLGEENRWQVVDLESANGTQINGKFIESGDGRELHDGDVLIFGASILLFRTG
jgi:pSer/pThr/pTyr-binding forkhead associated (FHA) protein